MATVRRRLESVFQHLYEVRWEHSYCSRVASQSSHPPEAVASIERLDQIALDETQVAFCLAAPRICCSDPAGKSAWEIRWCAHDGEV